MGARRAGRAIGRFLGAGIAGTAKAAATGGITYFGQKALTQRVEFLQKHPMAGPIGLVVLGHIGKKKFPTAGTAMIGAGVYAGALAYDLNKMAAAGQGGAQGGAAPASGTNALMSVEDIRALLPVEDIRGINIPGGEPALDISEAMAVGAPRGAGW